MSTEIGKRVQQVRGSAKLNQREFATKLSTSSGYISGVESGKTMPGGEFLLRIHQEFGVDVTWLLTGSSATTLPPAPNLELQPREAALLDNYRNSPDVGKDALERTASALAQSSVKSKRKVG